MKQEPKNETLVPRSLLLNRTETLATQAKRLHTKLYKGAWNVSANNSETVGNKELRLGQIVYIWVFYNISFSWLLLQDGFQFIFLLRDSENDLLLSSITFKAHKTESGNEDTPMCHWLSICYRFSRGKTTLERSLTISNAIFISKHHLLQWIDEETNEQVV